jgi:putative nucleotidyltransferase with HDIG domain
MSKKSSIDKTKGRILGPPVIEVNIGNEEIGENMENERDYIRRLFPRVADIADEALRNKVVNVWLRAWKMSDHDKIEEQTAWPPAKDKLQLSNVDHTNQVVECAIGVADIVGRTQKIKVNLDYIIGAAILHDVDKMILFHKETGAPTRFGELLSHTTLAVYLALDENLPLEIVHAIGAHSPNYSKIPHKTNEALILSYVDTLMSLNWEMSKKIDVSYKMEPNY